MSRRLPAKIVTRQRWISSRLPPRRDFAGGGRGGRDRTQFIQDITKDLPHVQGHRTLGPELRFENFEASENSETGAPQTRPDDDIFGDIFAEFSPDDDQTQQSAEPVEKVAPPIRDEDIAGCDPREFVEDQLIWCVGRAATLKISDQELWQRFAEAIKTIGEANLSPLSVCRLVQAFAYAPTDAYVDGKQLQRLLKAFARRAKEYNDDKLSRLIYGYGKLAVKRGLSQQKFFDFVASEVTERSVRLQAWRKVQILQAIWHLPGASDEFRSVLLSQVFRHVSALSPEGFRKLVPMLVEFEFHLRPGVVAKLNTIYKQRLRAWSTPEFLLDSGIPLVLHDIMKTATLVSWLNRLHDLQIQIQESQSTEIDEGVSSEEKKHRVAIRATKNLEGLKIIELCLRHERPTVHAMLPPRALDLLNTARRTPLRPPDQYEMMELPFVFAQLRRSCNCVGLILHATVFGPYLLDLADPLGQVAVEWDTNWELYPPWRRRQHEQFVRRKHLHLRAEGWKVLLLPLVEFQSQETWEDKLEFLARFAAQNGLSYLRLTPHELASIGSAAGDMTQ